MTQRWTGLDLSIYADTPVFRDMLSIDNQLRDLSEAVNPGATALESAPGAAPNDASYLTLANETTLSNERRVIIDLPLTSDVTDTSVTLGFDLSTDLLTGYLSSVADDSGTGSYTLSNAIPLVLSDATPEIETGAADSDTSNRLKFKDRNTNAVGKKSYFVDFENGNNDIFSFVVQDAQVAFTAPSNLDLILTALGTGDIKFAAGGDISFNATAALDVIGVAVWDYQSTAAVTLGTTTAVSATYTVETTGAFAANLTISLPQFGGPGKIAYDKTGTPFTGSENFEIEAASGDLQLTANGVINFLKAIRVATETFTSADTLDATNYFCRGDTTSGGFTLTFPPAAAAGDGATFIIKKVSLDANVLSVDGDGSDTIDGDPSVDIAVLESLTFRSNGTDNWDVT